MYKNINKKGVIFIEQIIYTDLEGREPERWVKLDKDPKIKPMYEISNYGRVRNGDKKILKVDMDKDGYLKFTLQGCDGKKIKRFSHRLVGLHYIPNPKNKPEINHIRCIETENGNISPHDDNYYENLEWCTRQENINHSIKHNLQIEHNAHHKFDVDTVEFICYLFEKGMSEKKIMKILGFKNTKQENYTSFRKLVKNLHNRNTWKDITDLYNY